MGTSVLIDGAHFLSKTATGIGSYARTLAATLRESACDVGVLYGQRAHAQPGQPLALAAQVFGNQPRPRWRAQWLRETPFLLRAAFGGGRRSRAVPVEIDGVDLSAFQPTLPPATQSFNAYALFERSHRVFAMNGRFMEVETPGRWQAMHWTTPLALKARGMPNIYTIHDLIPLQFPYFVVDESARSVQLHAEIARHADHIVTDSEASKGRIMKLLGVREERVTVTYVPVPSLPKMPRADAERLVQTVYGTEPGAYALYLGAIEPRKNLRRLIEAFLLSRTDIPLLVVGPLGWLYDDDLDLIEKLAGNADQAPVRRLGYLPRHHVVALLQCARFLAFPSIYEGFGLPVLEAMQLGVPALTSTTSSLPEVAGDAAVLVDPLDVAAMAREIRRLASDGDLRTELARRGPLQAARFGREAFRERLSAAYRTVGVDIGYARAKPNSGAAAGQRLHPAPATSPAG